MKLLEEYLVNSAMSALALGKHFEATSDFLFD